MFKFDPNWRSSKAFIILVICVATFVDGFIFGIVVPVYPFLLQDRNIVTGSKLQMYTSVLTAAFPIADLVAAPICAFYVDHYRQRRVPWYLGLVGIVGGTVLFGVGDSFGLLVTSRLLQGASSAILYTVGLAVLVESVRKDEVGRFMGSAMSANNVGIILSPLLGGSLYKAKGKMAVFAIMCAMIGCDIILRLLMVEKKNVIPEAAVEVAKEQIVEDKIEKPPTVCIRAVDEISVTTTSLSEKPGFVRTASCESVALSTKGTISRFAGVLKLVRSPRLLAALYGCFINECIVASLCAILPLFVERTFHWTSLQAGLLFLTIAIPGMAGSFAGYLADKLGARWVSVAGLTLTAPSLISMMAVSRNDTVHIAVLCLLLTLAGSTIVFFLSPLGADLTIVADELSEELDMDLYASSFSLMNTALATAGVVGPLFVGFLQEQLGFKAACTAMGLLCISGVVPCALYTGSRSNPDQVVDEP